MSKSRRPHFPQPLPSAGRSGPTTATDDTPLLRQARQLWTERRWDEALRRFEQAVVDAPGNIRALVDAARAFGARYCFDRAEALLRCLLDQAGNNPVILAHAGESYRLIHRLPEAIACYERALALADGQTAVELDLARLYERRHRLVEAQTLIERVLRNRPDWLPAQLTLGRIQRRLKLEAAAESTLRGLLSHPVSDPDLFAEAWAELAQLLDGRGDYDGAMEATVLGKQLMLPRDAAERQTSAVVVGRYQNLIESLNASDLQRWLEASAPLAGHPPLALLTGFPRTGTTLLEQVLDGHPHAVSSEERDIMGFEVVPDLVQSVSERVSLKDTLDRVDLEVLRRGQARYLQNNESWIGQPLGQRLLIDKSPGSTLLLPIFLRIFPQFRTLVALRDPRDVVLSCFLLYLPLNPLSVSFLTLERAARRYALDMSAWLKLRELFPRPWLEVRYEDTVADLGAQARRVLQFLGLPWDPAVLNFHERAQQRPVLSPTYAAVAQPLHSRAIGRWHHYADYLEPVFPILDPLIKAFGYGE